MSSSEPSFQRSCSVCHDLDPVLPQPDRMGILQMKNSAKDGCPGCCVLNTVMTPFWSGYKLSDTCWWTYCDSDKTLTIDMFYRPNRFVFGKGKLVARIQLWTLTRRSLLLT